MARELNFTGAEMSFADAQELHTGLTLKVTEKAQGKIPTGTFFFQANDGWWGMTGNNAKPSKEECLKGDYIFREYFHDDGDGKLSKRWILAKRGGLEGTEVW